MIEARGYAAELTRDQLLGLYDTMLTGRLLETRLHDLARAGELRGDLYPGVGQEAAMVGFAAALEGDDVFGGTRRDLVAMLAKGLTIEAAVLNFFGKAASPTRGRAGGTHLGMPEAGILMVVPAAAEACPVAVGCALAFDQRGEPRVAMAHVGEGATASGAWHESVNFAAVKRLPVVFAVQNNQYAGATRNEGGSALPYVAHRADGYGIPGVVVDGNDVLEVYAAAREAVERARSGHGPTVIEAVTFRILGHTATDDADYVKPDERDQWQRRDPMPRFEEYLGVMGYLDEPRRAAIRERVTAEIDRAISWALDQPDPDPGIVARGLFAAAPAGDPESQPERTETMDFTEALRTGLDDEMARDERVFLIGQDLGRLGGRHGVAESIMDRYGPARVIDAPVADIAVVGAAIGAAIQGQRPVADLQEADFVWPALGQVFGQAARHHWATGRSVPMVLRIPTGPGAGTGPGGSGSPEALLAQHPGIKIVVPATPAAARGLLAGAIRDPDPVVFLDPKSLATEVGAVPSAAGVIPPGIARVAREGDDVTLVAWGSAVRVALAAAGTLEGEGVAAEVIDLQSLAPIDWATVLGSVGRTTRLVVVQEGAVFAGIGAEVAARVAAEAMWELDGPILRVAPPHTHVPFATTLEEAYALTPIAVVEAVRSLGSS